MGDFLKSEAFTWLLNALFFALVLIVYWSAISALRRGHSQNRVDYAPTLMTSMGLFGTFLGIFIGLLQFDPNHIDGSIEQLLGGLQTAFVTSIIGMFFAMLFKFQQTRYLDSQQVIATEAAQNGVEPKDIHQVLVKQQTLLDSIAKGIGGGDGRSLLGEARALHVDVLKQQTLLDIIAKGIGGGDERSMVGQMQMLRTDVMDFRSGTQKRQEQFEAKLWKQMDDFAEMMSKAATQQVIDALNQVIQEFNQNLTEQFGDNFKRLDESVKKLIDWQDNYAKQLDEMGRLYKEGTDSIGATQVAVESIRMETAKIPEDMRALGDVMAVNQHQIGELSRHLDAFVEMRNQAATAMPQIQEKLEAMSQQLLNGAEKVNASLIQGSEQFQDSVKLTSSSLTQVAHDMAVQAEGISEEMADAMGVLALNTERIRSGVTTTISESMGAIEAHTKTVAQNHGEAATAILSALEAAVRKASDGLHDSAASSVQAMEQHGKDVVAQNGLVAKALQDALKKAMSAAVDGSDQARKATQQAIEDNNTAIVQHAERAMGAVEKQVQHAVNQTNEAVNSQLRQLDEALSRQLNAALKDLGTSLASIAEHLMKTYQQGTERSRSRV